jgi:hypothetical protein
VHRSYALTARIPSLITILLATVFSPHAVGQTTSSKPTRTKPAPTGQTGKSSAGDKSTGPSDAVTTLQNKVVSDVDPVHPDIGDYIPCEFSREQLLYLRPQPDVLTLTAAEEDALRSKVIAEAMADDNNAAFKTREDAQAFVKAIFQEPFEGLTPSQALGRVLVLLGRYTKPSEAAEKMHDALNVSPPRFAQLFTNTYGVNDPAKKQKLTQKMNQAVSAGSQEDAAAAASRVVDENKELVNTPEVAEKDLSDLKKDLKASPLKDKVANAARQTVSDIARPTDVGCSMSILSYTGTKYAFGQKMADEFIAVQIVIRNLSKDKEFVVHDAEFAVDGDINGRHGRYFSGVDKLTARQFMLAGRDYGHRNFVVHVAQGVGTILSSVSLVYGTAIKDAASVYNAGFLTALTSVWTDHGTEQLNLLNDEGFSSYRTERTVVPKQGTAEFVIFVPSKQFEQGWWAQDCANELAIRNDSGGATQNDSESATGTSLDKKDGGKSEAACIGQFNTLSPDPKCFKDNGIGVDLGTARLVCIDYLEKQGHHPAKTKKQKETGDGQVPIEKSADQGDLHTIKDTKLSYFAPKEVDYKHWKPRSLALFRELSFSVVAGTHILEEKDIKPAISKIDCPADDQGDLKFDSAKDGAISCKLTGTNLDKAEKIKLRNAQDATDTKTAEGSVSTSGDSKAATASLVLDQLCPLNGKAYKVYTVTKDAIEDGGNQIVHLNVDPRLTAPPDPATVDVAKLKGKGAQKVTITLTGCHLDKLKEIELTGTFTVPRLPAETHEANKATVSLGPDQVKSIVGDLTSTKAPLISLFSTDAPGTSIPTSKSLGLTGKVETPAPAKPAKAGPKPPPTAKKAPATGKPPAPGSPNP